ncbi:hypothetical protein GCM10007067_12490 [Lysobacter bugurensis]|uniref:Lipoprotein n=1 Tax=Cognatilysobacter bugurensis TaxID=543356 RepID=A0A918SX49_9GAMM|nr:hypothetical protein GCM10007067_12490 [Lysobacter bugurensis]
MGKFQALVVASALAASGCDVAGCENEISARAPSPSGGRDAVVINRGCGATTGFNTQLAIVDAGHVPEGAGNVLVLDGTVPLRLTWRGDRSLHVEGAGGSRVFKREASADGVSISYGR